MAKAKHTYAVRLGVEGGNRVKADLVSVGTSGERSIKKIGRASNRASRGLGTLSDRASSLRRNMRLLGGVVAGVAAVGGLALLVKRSIDAADSIGKLSGAIGVGTDTLQELRYAAGLAGVSTGQLDGAMVAFSKRVGEARSGTGTLITLLKKMDPALLANVQAARTVDEAFEIIIRRASALGNTLDRNALLAAAFGRTVGPLMANLIRDGVESLDRLRQRAHDLGIVLDEELIPNAERAKDEMDTLGQVLSANLNKAILEHADAIGDLAKRFTESLPDLISWVSTFGKWIGLIEESPAERLAEIRKRIAEIDESLKSLFTQMLEFDIFGREGPLAAERRQLIAELAALERLKAEQALEPPPSLTSTVTTVTVVDDDDPDDPVMTAKQQARRLVQIEKSLNTQLFQLRHQGADRIRAEHLKLVTELQHLIKPDGSNLDEIEQVLNDAAAARDLKLTQLADREKEIADRRVQANQRVIDSLGFELEALGKIERQRFIDVALRRLSAEAIPKQRKEVERLAGALFDELEKIKETNKARERENQLRAEGKALTESLRTAQEAYTAEIERLRELLDAGAIDQETFGRASEEAYDRMLRSSREWSDGLRRAIRDYLDDATDAAKTFEQATTRALKASEDAFIEWAQTGKFSAKDLFDTIAEEALRAAYRMAVAPPLNNILGSIFDAIGRGFSGGRYAGAAPGTAPIIPVYSVPLPVLLPHGGGVIGRDAFPARMVDPAVFDGASRYHRGGIVAGEVPIVARHGEGMFTPGQMRSLAPVSAAKPVVNVAVNVRNTAPGTQASANVRRELGGNLTLDIMIEQIEGGMARNIGRGQGMAPTLEYRYGLNPAAGSLR